MDIFIRFRDFCYYNRKIICFALVVAFFVLFFYFEFSFSSVEENIVNEVVLEKKDEVVLDNEYICLIVDIKGAVKSPGTYEVLNEKGIIDVINMAGGILDDGDTSNVNLSKKVSDEMVIFIPFKNKDNNNVINEVTNNEVSYSQVSDDKVSINDASLSELMTINGIGEVKAKSIVEYRNNNGRFKSIEDIKNVSGIGNSTFEKIKNYIKL